MNKNEELITNFYKAFQQKDYRKMSECYHSDIMFEDPAFGKLTGADVSKMWEVLCKNGKDLELTFSNVQSESSKGSAHWEAKYTFGRTGRKVHNKIDASFEIKDGKIIRHVDQFNLHAWAKQAFGLKGFLLGGTGFFKKKLQLQTKKMLLKDG